MLPDINSSHAFVLVFGDLGHSPRMQNHVREFIDAGFTVDFAGNSESELPRDMNSASLRTIFIPNINIEPPFVPNFMLRIVNILLKLILQTSFVIWIGLMTIRSPSVILVQTPPVLPTLPVCYLLAKWHRAKFIVDWHNIGYTILAQTLKSPAVIATAKAVELLMAKTADINFVVSKAQKQWMQINAGITTMVLYDLPVPSRFCQLAKTDRKEFRISIRERLGWDRNDTVPMIVSSTSWTHDEDFGILVDALPLIKHRIQLLITGKGPRKTFYEKKILELELTNVQFATLWLSFEEYAKLLGSADLGICLHNSSSGVDLPMKVIDMIASGLPVAAVKFPAISELIEDGKTGFLFKTPQQLADVINSYLGNPKNLKIPKLETWHEQWKRIALPMIALDKSGH